MRVTTKITFDLDGHVLEHEFYEYAGPVALCKGASSAQNNISAGQSDFFNKLQASYGQTFANSNQILQQLRTAWRGVLKAGPNQYGFSTAEDQAYRAQIAQGRAATQDAIGAQYANEAKVLGEDQAAVGGGNVPLPSGAQAAERESVMSRAVAAEAGNERQAALENLGVTEKGYEVGRNLFDRASTVFGEGFKGETGFASELARFAPDAGAKAFDSASAIQKLNAEASPWRAIGGAVGSLAGGAAALIPGVGPIVAPMVSGAVSGLMGGGASSPANFRRPSGGDGGGGGGSDDFSSGSWF